MNSAHDQSLEPPEVDGQLGRGMSRIGQDHARFALADGVVTFMSECRRLALMESRALRGYARYGVIPPVCRPIDYWAEWQQAHPFARQAA